MRQSAAPIYPLSSSRYKDCESPVLFLVLSTPASRSSIRLLGDASQARHFTARQSSARTSLHRNIGNRRVSLRTTPPVAASSRQHRQHLPAGVRVPIGENGRSHRDSAHVPCLPMSHRRQPTQLVRPKELLLYRFSSGLKIPAFIKCVSEHSISAVSVARDLC